MENAELVAAEPTEMLSWDDICTRYPDQFVCLVDIVNLALRSPIITSARVVGHGTTGDEAFEPLRELAQRYPYFAVRFTGVFTEPLNLLPRMIRVDETDDPFRHRP